MSTILSDSDLEAMSKEDKKNLVEQRLRGLTVTLASGMLDRAAIVDLPGAEEQVKGADAAISGLRSAIVLHRTELEALS